MNIIFLLGFPALLFCNVALGQDSAEQGLYCYSCGFGETCRDTSKKLCGEGTQCGIVKGLSEYKVHEPVLAKGCIATNKCNNQERHIYMGTPFRIQYSCCTGNLCNSGGPGASNSSPSDRVLLDSLNYTTGTLCEVVIVKCYGNKTPDK